MNIVELTTFLTIIGSGILVNASKELHVTQSTVTARLKVLEKELGQTLINRHKSGITLTVAGQRLRRYASTMTELWKQAKQTTSLPDSVNTVCNIGCHPDLWPSLGEDLFEQLRQTHDSIAISVWLGGRIELESWQRANLVNISISYWAANQGKVDVQSLSDDELILVSTNQTSPARGDANYVHIEGGEEFNRDHAAAFADADAARISFGSASLGLEHILKVGGSGYIPKRLAVPLITQGKLHALGGAPSFKRKIYLTIGDELPQNLAIKDMLSTVN